MTDDSISRRAAIYALMARDKELRNINWYDKPYAEGECRGIDEALAIVSNLPSAQPDIAEKLYQYKCYITDKEGLQHEVVHTGDIRRVTGWEI